MSDEKFFGSAGNTEVPRSEAEVAEPEVVSTGSEASSDDGSHTGPIAGRSTLADTTPGAPPENTLTKERVCKLLAEGVKLADIASSHDTTVEILRELLKDTEEATVSIALPDDNERREALRSKLLTVAEKIAVKIENSKDNEFSDLTRAKAYETYAKAITLLQSGIVNNLPKITLEASKENVQFFESIALENDNS